MHLNANVKKNAYFNFLRIILFAVISIIYPFICCAQPYAYVASIAGSTVTVVNVANNSIVASPYIPGGMTGIAVAPDGATAYVTAQSTNQLEVFSTATNSVIGAIGVGAVPIAVAVSPNGALAYVVNQNSNSVTVVNTAANAAVATIPVGQRPSAVAFNPSGTLALVTNKWDTVLTVINTATNTVAANIAAGYGLSSIAVSPNGAYAYATNQSLNALAVVNLSSYSLVANIPVQANPTSVALTPNGARAFVTNGNSNSVSVIDTASSSVIATLGVGATPSSIAISPDGSRAEVTNQSDYSASLIDANALYVISNVAHVGISPSSVAMAPAAGSGGSTVPIPCNYNLSSNAQSFPYTGGSGAVGVGISTGATGCNWTSTSNAGWITLVSGLAGSGAGTTGFTVAANPSTSPRSGTFTIAGLTFTITQTGAPATSGPPTADAISPSAGSASSQTFVASFSDPAGFNNISYVHLLIAGALNPSSACWVTYVRGSNALYLLNDSATGFLGPITPGVAGTVSNSQCTLDAGGSSVSGAGNTLWVAFALSFRPSFGGAKYAYMIAVDYGGLDSGWQYRGGWTVPGGVAPVAPTADYVSPYTGGGTGATFWTLSTDGNGATDLAWVYLLFNSSLNGTGACYALYNRPTNALYLVNDQGTGVLGPLKLGSPGVLANNQCALDAGGSSVGLSGNSMVVNFAITFRQAFSGQKMSYELAIDNENLNSGWQARGTYNVQF